MPISGIRLSDRLRGRPTATTGRRRLRLAVELVRSAPDRSRCSAGLRQSPRSSPTSQARLKSGAFAPPELPGLNALTPLSDSRPTHRLKAMVEMRPPTGRVSPDYPCHPSNVPCPLPRRTEQGHASMACLFVRPSPSTRRVGVRIGSFEACSGCTRVTARRIAQPPRAAFVTRLRPGQSPSRTARQLPDSSTIIRVEPPSTSNTRLRGARVPTGYATGEVIWGTGKYAGMTSANLSTCQFSGNATNDPAHCSVTCDVQGSYKMP